MATKELAVEAWIWANMLILFREIDPPELFREYGLKQAEFDTLTQLFLSDRPLTQTELKKRLLTTKGSVSLMLSKMEKQGFVRREGDRKDHRQKDLEVFLAPDGPGEGDPVEDPHQASQDGRVRGRRRGNRRREGIVMSWSSDNDAVGIRVLLSVGLGTLMSALDASVVNTVLPVIRAEYRVPVGVIQWVSTTYLLIMGSLLLTFGRLGDLRGHKRVYLAGIMVFVP
ncbi:MAG: drug resistance transporter, EmrB/QacA subfamily, partial [Deltaproteobacteria bacterium]|nr:drug resistance transporter, EmrB/QacA subfamily [Deltaproteobacteria bacterium]